MTGAGKIEPLAAPPRRDAVFCPPLLLMLPHPVGEFSTGAEPEMMLTGVR